MLEHTIEGCQCEGKRCSKCKEVKCYAAFPSDKRKASGITSPCLTCKRARQNLRRAGNVEQARAKQREYRSTHVEQVRAYHKSYKKNHAEDLNAKERDRYHKSAEQINAARRQLRHENAEQARAYHREYRRIHAEHTNELQRSYYHTPDQKAQKQAYYRENAKRIKDLRKVHQKTHSEQIKKYRTRRYQENAEQFKAQKRDYYEENVELIREKKRNHRRAHPELYAGADKAKFAKRRTLETQAGGSYTKQEWQELCIKYSYRCLCCGKQEPEIKLVADHVIPVTQMGTSNIDNIQPLCGSCNSKKHNKFIDYRR